MFRSVQVELLEQQCGGRSLAFGEILNRLRSVLFGKEEVMFFRDRERACSALQCKGHEGAVCRYPPPFGFKQCVESWSRGTLFGPAPELLDGNTAAGQAVVFGQNPGAVRKRQWASDNAKTQRRRRQNDLCLRSGYPTGRTAGSVIPRCRRDWNLSPIRSC